MPTLSANQIHIFKSGNHTPMTGDTLEFSDEHVSQTAASYDPAISEAPMVVGHPKTDAPAFGWVKSLSSENGELYANVNQVNPEFADAVKAGSYKKISSCFYAPDAPNNPVPGVYYLKHIGFLGAAPPAVKGLKQVEFSEAEEGLVTIEFADVSGWTIADIGRALGKIVEFLKGEYGNEKVDAVIPAYTPDSIIEQGAYEAGKEAAKEEPETTPSFADFKDPPSVEDKMSKELEKREADLAARIKAQDAKELSFAQEKSRAEAETFINDLVKTGQVLPAQKEELISFAANLSAEHTISFADGDETKTTDSKTFFQNFLKTLPNQVDFAERTAGQNAVDTVSFACPSGYTVDDEKVEKHSKALALQQQNPGMSYIDAVKQS